MLDKGVSVSHYKILGPIGAGGMGEVYLAEDTRLGRQVAVKFLLPEVANDEDRLQRFILEAKAASSLNHPNILTIYEIGEFEGAHYISAEYVKGETLRQRTKRGEMSLDDALGIAQQIANALSAAHGAGIVHRDIKPENLMIREDGIVKVLDFGLAKLLGDVAAAPSESEDSTRVKFATEPGTIVGTTAYMSPEQARGKVLDARSDIFSLGIVLYELFAGTLPFKGESTLDIISSILKDDPPGIRQFSPDLPRQLERIVDKTLRKDREQRYQHVRDLEIDLQDLREELKFEGKLNKSAATTIRAGAGKTTSTDLRSAFATGISKTKVFTLLHAFIFLLAVAVIGGAVWYLMPAKSGPANKTYKSVEVASWNSAPGELFSHARFSPDGRMIAFASTKSGTKNIWVTQTGSTEAIKVTDDAFSNTDPVWSPKGDEIAYFSDRGAAGAGGNVTGIWRVSALGGTPKMLGQLSDRNVELRRWAASGKIYYELKKDLYSLDVSSGASLKVTSLGASSVSFINIGADERSIVYAELDNKRWRILSGAIDTDKTTEIAKGEGQIDGLVWLSDKGRIFYSASVDGVLQVFGCEMRSGKSTRITSSETDASVVDASQEGRSILFSSAKEESNLWRVSVSDAQEQPLARDLNSKLWPAVSPDGTRVAFQSEKDMSLGNHLFDGAIMVKPVKARDDGERPTPLVEHGFLPTWSPDGSAIAFLRDNAGKKELFSINPNGGGERRLGSGTISTAGYSVSPYNYTQTTGFSWSPDSSSIAFISEAGGTTNVVVVQVKDGTERSLTANADNGLLYACPMWSPDGKQIAVTLRTKSTATTKESVALKVIDASTGTSADVFRSEQVVRLIGWSADNAGLILAEAEKLSGLPPETTLKRVALGGGAEKPLANLKNAYYYNIFLASDLKSIAFAARNEDKDDLWVVPAPGGTARRITNNNDSGLYYSRLSWFRDGTSIAFGKQTRFSLLSMISDIEW